MSAMSNNPAAIGLYRRSDVAMTASVLGQSEAYKLADVNKARASFDQAGFVYAAKLNGSAVKFVNLGFNYQKRRNLKEVIGLGHTRLNEGMSQSWQMLDLSYYDGWLDLSNDNDREYTTPLACRVMPTPTNTAAHAGAASSSTTSTSRSTSTTASTAALPWASTTWTYTASRAIRKRSGWAMK